MKIRSQAEADALWKEAQRIMSKNSKGEHPGKARAVELLRQGVKVAAVAMECGADERSVYKWRRKAGL